MKKSTLAERMWLYTAATTTVLAGAFLGHLEYQARPGHVPFLNVLIGLIVGITLVGVNLKTRGQSHHLKLSNRILWTTAGCGVYFAFVVLTGVNGLLGKDAALVAGTVAAALVLSIL